MGTKCITTLTTVGALDSRHPYGDLTVGLLIHTPILSIIIIPMEVTGVPLHTILIIIMITIIIMVLIQFLIPLTI